MRLINDLKSKFIGQRKEQQASAWLKGKNIEIIAENYLCKGGEIDLIGLDKHQNRLIFFEVKYRKNTLYGHPAEMITPKQQQRILRCAQRFLQTHPQYQNYPMQFDVLTFLADQSEPEQIENAFGL